MDGSASQERASEKLPVDANVYTGLETVLPAHLLKAEKERHTVDGLQVADNSLYLPNHGVGENDRSMNAVSAHQQSENRGRYCGACNTVILVVLVVLVTLAAILGGVLGSRSTSSRSTSSSSPSSSQTVASASPSSSSAQPAAPSIINGNLPKTDVMAASPLAPISYLDETSPGVETFSLFYQSADGTTKLTNRGGLYGSWQPASEIISDGLNNTGITALTYPNGSVPQSTIFYIGSSNGRIREKRQDPSGNWHLGPLTKMHLSVSGNSSTPGEGDWNGLRLTGVYSANFSNGPGARLFFHQRNDTLTWVQEMIWTQNDDSWVYGNQIEGPQQGSHLSAVIETESQSLRLFYSTFNNSVQEIWCNITSPNATYQPGVSLDNILLHEYDDFSSVSILDSTFLYYSSSLAPDSNITIRELALPLLPNVSVSENSSVLVAEPSLQAIDSGGRNASDFVPLAAIAAPHGNAIIVFYPEDAVDPESGYGKLQSVWRLTNETWGNVSYGQAQNVAQIHLEGTV